MHWSSASAFNLPQRQPRKMIQYWSRCQTTDSAQITAIVAVTVLVRVFAIVIVTVNIIVTVPLVPLVPLAPLAPYVNYLFHAFFSPTERVASGSSGASGVERVARVARTTSSPRPLPCVVALFWGQLVPLAPLPAERNLRVCWFGMAAVAYLKLLELRACAGIYTKSFAALPVPLFPVASLARVARATLIFPPERLQCTYSYSKEESIRYSNDKSNASYNKPALQK